MIPSFINKFLIFICTQIVFTDSACTLPSLLDGPWYDSSVNGAITITRSLLTVNPGWSFKVYSSTFDTFICEESDNEYWLFRTDGTVLAFGQNYYGFLCIKYTKITDYSYSYYLNSDEEPESDYKRLKIVHEATVAAGVTVSGVCSPSSGPRAEEFHVLVKQSNIADVKQWFPDALLGVYAYTVDGSLCGDGSVWDACTNRTTMKFNYTQCATQMFGSTSGELYATKYVTSGSHTYVVVINSDGSMSNRFTCLAASGSKVVSNPGSCAKGQNTTYKTADAASVMITLEAYETCPFNTASESSSSSNAGIIAGVIVVIILLAAGAVGGFIFYYKRKHHRFPWQKAKVDHGANDENSEKLPGNEPSSPRIAVDIEPSSDRRLPPLPKPSAPPISDVNHNPPLPSITRQ